MITTEQRKQRRYSPERQPNGEFFLRSGGVRHRIKSVHDVSNEGMSFLLENDLAVAADVVIEHSGPGVKLEVHGTVVWCRPAEALPERGAAAAGFAMGVELLSPLLLLTFLPKH